jgi:gas vesicle protein
MTKRNFETKNTGEILADAKYIMAACDKEEIQRMYEDCSKRHDELIKQIVEDLQPHQRRARLEEASAVMERKLAELKAKDTTQATPEDFINDLMDTLAAFQNALQGLK